MPSLPSSPRVRSSRSLEQVGQGDDLDVGVLDLRPLGHVLGVVALGRVNDLRGRTERVEHALRCLARRSRSVRS